jgi:hypothetical protein
VLNQVAVVEMLRSLMLAVVLPNIGCSVLVYSAVFAKQRVYIAVSSLL